MKHSTFNIQRSTPKVGTQHTLGVQCWMLVVGCFFLFTATTRAQTPLSNLLYTVGTTINSGGQDRSYVVVDSFDGVAGRGKRFAVYGKPGGPTNAVPFTVRGTMAPQTDVGTINAILTQSVALGQNLSSLNDGLAMVLHNIPGVTNQTLAQKVSTAVQAAATDQELEEFLHLLATGNPGFQICFGRAFTETIGGVTTYEVRELSPISGAAGDVVGRVTIVPGAPVVLPAPGRPFQVVTNHPSDHLKIKLRWGTPPELRRLSVLNAGFDLWRIPRALAESGGFNVTPPTPAQLLSNPNFAKANRASVATTTDYNTGSGAGAADDPADRITFFFADDGHGSGWPPFLDGQEFYYFVTARDLLGRDGLASPGGLTRACRRIPPAAPTDVRVENVVLTGTTNFPRLQVTWIQNPNTNRIVQFTNDSGVMMRRTNSSDLVTHYWIYRWPNPTMMFTNDAAPASNRIGIVSHLVGTNRNTFMDDTPGAYTTPGLSNAWYTVRAVSVAACDPLLSPHAGPAWGVLRQRDGPGATTGELVGSCGTPVVMFQNFATNTVTANTQNWQLKLTCIRRDAGIAWVKFNVTNTENVVDSIGPIYFPPTGDTVQWNYEPPAYTPALAGQIRVGCVVGTTYDLVSGEVLRTVNVPMPFNQQREVIFYAGQLLMTALKSTDPLLLSVNGQSQCYPANNVLPDASGMVSMTFNLAPTPLLVQGLTNNTWFDIAVVTPDSNGLYWVSYPACLVGPLPQFRGCTINLPVESGCDQHISRAADDGDIAPVRVRFRLMPRTQEYRVYRRADEGPMTLLAQGAAAYDPTKPTKVMETKDEAMPPSAAQLCYFVQLLDEHGNGSPLAFIGCTYAKPPKMPRPLLGEPQPVGTVGSPQVLLNWFCPTSGVSRFQFKIRRISPPDPVSPGLVSVKLFSFPGYDKSAIYTGLYKRNISYLQFTEAYFTTPIGPSFGPGPQFTITANVQADVEYEITVAPVDAQGKVHDESISEAWRFTWVPPVVLATVPWPKRLLPPISSFDPVAGSLPVEAVLLRDPNFFLDRRYPVGIRIGQMDRDTDRMGVQFNIRSDSYAGYNIYFGGGDNPDANTYLIRRKSTGEPVLPMVVYRQQITNSLFPKVSGDITQVSPLIERVPWAIVPFSVDYTTVVIPDRLFALGFENINNGAFYPLYLRDQQPAQLGAKYRYFVLRFNSKREVQEVIPAGEVELPVN